MNCSFGNYDYTNSYSQKNVNNFIQSNQGNIQKNQNQNPGSKILPTSRDLNNNYDDDEIEKRLFAFDFID